MTLKGRLRLFKQFDCPLGRLSDGFHFMDSGRLQGFENDNSVWDNRVWNGRSQGINRINTDFLSVPI